VAAALVVLAASAASIFQPATKLPSMVYLRPPSNEWPYGIVSLDKKYWNVFIVRTPKNEWAVSVERGSPVGPEGLKNALATRFGPDNAKKRPVRLYQDMSCPDDIQKVFVDAAHELCDPLKVEVDTIPLPDKDNFQALRKLRREEQLAPFKDILQLGIFAHLAAAASLALVVWWTPRGVKGAGAVTAGNLLLAFGQAIALPVALYAAMLPDEAGPEFKRLAANLKPHLWISYASAAALAAGALNAFFGLLMVPEKLPEPQVFRPRVPLGLGNKPRSDAGSEPPPAAPPS
jgi:hypothetical protein